MAGYSGSSLAKKLGLKEGDRVYLFGIRHEDYLRLVETPIVETTPSEASIGHLFTDRREVLRTQLELTRQEMGPNAAVWVSWPKKASKAPTDITEDVIREEALPLGWVDVKVCAVDHYWSGLKLYVRKELR